VRPMPTNHPADVFRMDAQLKNDDLLSLDRTNLTSSGWSTRALAIISSSSFMARLRVCVCIVFSIGNATTKPKGR